MKKENFKELINEELKDKLLNLQKQLMDLSFQKKTGHVEKPHMFQQTKKDIARILTLLKERPGKHNA